MLLVVVVGYEREKHTDESRKFVISWC
jgi:hypothetical protein